MAKTPRILAGEAAAITGGARGIGCATAEALLRSGDLAALHFQDALEHAHRLSFFVNAMNSSSLCLAAPLLIAWLARSTPAFMVFATPAT